MTAAHAGYGSEELPLGGGAAVCERLCRAWAGRPGLEVTLLGPGPRAPAGVRYRQIDVLGGQVPSSLGELAYARFCRRFERAVTRALLAEPPAAVLCHDISEGPDFAALARAGHRCLAILHVDVVDFFHRMYLGGLASPAFWHRLFAWLRPWPVVPDLLRLVFDKQADAAAFCRHLVVPSPGMKELLGRTYGAEVAGRVEVVPWGAPAEQPDLAQVERCKEELRRRWSLEGPLVCTLSRLSPEKGLERLLAALAEGERRGQTPPGLTLALCGAPAYMRGAGYLRRLKRLAGRLRQVRVLFPGHMAGPWKRAVLEMAQVFVSPSRHESYGLTTMEALAAGCPAVALRTPGSEATLDSTCGLLVDPGPRLPERLWQALHSLLADPAARLQLGLGARRRAARETFPRAAERLLQLAL